MRTAPSLIALSVAGVIAFAGCSEGADETGETPGQEQQEGQEQDPQQAMPEPDTDDVPDVVATVNGEEIDREEFLASYESQFQQAVSQQMSAEQAGQPAEEIDEPALKEQVAQMLVDNRLLLQASEDAGIDPSDDDIDETLEEIAAQSGMESADEIVAALAEQGMSEDEIREEAASQYRVNTFIQEEADLEEPTEEDLRARYDGYAEEMEAAGGAEELPEFDEVRDQLEQEVTTQDQNAAAQEIVAGLNESADVTIHL